MSPSPRHHDAEERSEGDNANRDRKLTDGPCARTGIRQEEGVNEYEQHNEGKRRKNHYQ